MRLFIVALLMMVFLTAGCASTSRKAKHEDVTYGDSTHIKGEQEVIVKEEVVVE